MSIVQQNKRIARSPNDPFDQQQEDVSAFVLKTKPFKQHGQAILSSQNPRDNEISNTPLRSSRKRIPYYPPGSLHDDTLVNDLLLSNARRGGLISLERDAEFLYNEKQKTD